MAKEYFNLSEYAEEARKQVASLEKEYKEKKAILSKTPKGEKERE